MKNLHAWAWATLLIVSQFSAWTRPIAAAEDKVVDKTDSAAGVQQGEAKASSAPAKSDPNAWRYKWHNGKWWYYTPNKDWLVYQNDAWAPFVPSPVQVTVPAPMVMQNPPVSSYHYNRRPGYSSPQSSQSHSKSTRTLGDVGNYPRYWFWQRMEGGK
jgi:hypothetical protein